MQIFSAAFPRTQKPPKIKNIAMAIDKMRATSSGSVGSAASTKPAYSPSANSSNASNSLNSSAGKSFSAPSKVALASDYFADVTAQSGVFKWPANKMPIRVQIKELSAAEASAVPGYRSNFPAIIKRCFEDWGRVSNNLVKFAFVDSGSADIECFWTANANQFANSAEAGETKLSMSKSGKIVHGNIEILTVPMDATLPLTDNRLRKICLHEVGHALGLTGHTRNPDDIMFFTPVEIADLRTELKSRDINTLVRLYSTQ